MHSLTDVLRLAGVAATLGAANPGALPSAEVMLGRLLSSGATLSAAVIDDFSDEAECSRYRIVPASRNRGPYIVTAETRKRMSGHDLKLEVWPDGEVPIGHCAV